MKPSSKIKSTIGPFSIGLTLTAIYLGVITYEVLVVGASGEWIDGNKLNSLGDFLAGLFAPVAFLWLIVTVFLQKQELALTRQEMIETRGVMVDQAAESRAQKEFVEQQTGIMKRQAELAEVTYYKNRKLQMFDKRMEVYDEIKAFTEQPFSELVKDDSYLNFLHLLNKARFLFAGDEGLINWMNDLSELVYETINGGEIENVRNRWIDLTNPELFHMRFYAHLTLHD